MSNPDRKKTRRRRPQAKRGKTASHNQEGPAEVGDSSRPRESTRRLAWKKETIRWLFGVLRENPALGVAGLVVLATFVWAYWPTLVNLVSTWDREPDYSHGYFVVPLALFFLYARRDTFPGLKSGLAWPGLALIALSIAIRTFGARYYVDAIDGWSILIWVAGVVWLLGGWRVLWWSAPSIAFLWFMIPLPWRVERWLSLPLQRIATKISCAGLQCFGQPALSEGNIIHIDEFPLEVAQACSGLRIFVGIVALAFAYIILVKRAWWERALLLLSVVPIALIANSTRIIATGLLNQWVSGEAAHKFTHDVSGYVMIPFAAGLFALVLWYLGNVMREVEIVGAGEIARREAAEA